jgi:predicted dienelactone hydrolase
VWSHGLYGSRETYRGLGEYWASHGYVVIHPSHEDSLQDGTHRSVLRKALQDPELIESRPRDISLVISSLAEIERMQPALRGKIDGSRVGVGGHSYGAYTSEAIAGASVTMPDSKKTVNFADKRVKAAVAMSPQGEGEMGLTRDSWKGIHIPVLTMYGSLDVGSQRRTPDWRSQPFSYSAPGDKYDVELKGATHMTFTGPRRGGASEDKLFQCAKIEALAFWDAYLKPDPAGKKYIDSDALNTFCDGKARIGRK